MLGVFGSLASSVPLNKRLNQPHTEGKINRLHYSATVLIFFGCSLLVTCLEWVGNGSKISCVMEGAEDSWTIPKNVINTYCYVLTTFTLPKHWNSKIGYEAAHMGVGAYNPAKDEVTYKAYYQWVPFVLFLQGCCFYFPHLLFKAWEGGKVKNIIAGLHHFILSEDDRKTKEKMLAKYMVESLNTHNYWAFKMLIIEFINLVNVVGQIYFVDAFLGGEFSTYGIKVLSFLEADPEKRIDPMSAVFPRVTKCSFFKYGPSGTPQTHDAICVLPVNIVNEKIYVFLWFWMILLSALTVFSVMYHIFQMISTAYTKSKIRGRSMHQVDTELEEMNSHFELGDWKLLYILSSNMEPLVVTEFLRELKKALRLSTNDDNSTITKSSGRKSADPKGKQILMV